MLKSSPQFVPKKKKLGHCGDNPSMDCGTIKERAGIGPAHAVSAARPLLIRPVHLPFWQPSALEVPATARSERPTTPRLNRLQKFSIPLV